MVYSDYTSYTYTNVGFTAEQNKLDHILIYSPQEGSVNICKKNTTKRLTCWCIKLI